MQVLHEEVNFILSHLLINSLLICSSSVLTIFLRNPFTCLAISF